MATEILMPRQGNSVESCVILEWRKNEGDSVKSGEIVCEVETDKATFEVESPADGVLLKQFFPEGEGCPGPDPDSRGGRCRPRRSRRIRARRPRRRRRPKRSQPRPRLLPPRRLLLRRRYRRSIRLPGPPPETLPRHQGPERAPATAASTSQESPVPVPGDGLSSGMCSPPRLSHR